jgi:preprotein translocase subunit SecF
MVGIIVGTFSSIFVASPLLTYLNLKRDKFGGDPNSEGRSAANVG